MEKRERARKRAEELVSQMTVEEMASLLRYDSPPIKRLGIKAYNWWNEGIHGLARAGTATVFPVALGLAAAFDTGLMEAVAEAIADEARAKYNAYQREGDLGIYKGLTIWSPNLNLFRDPRWGRGHETYGEDPCLTGTMGVAFIGGLQGSDETYLKTAACVKHLAAHSGPEELRHEINVEPSPKDLEESYLPAFRQCVTEGRAEGAMGGYNRLNGEPCCGSRYLIRDLLRGTWGFEGYYVSDCFALRDFHEHHRVTGDMTESAALALSAGCDVNCGNTYLYLLQALKRGLITAAQIRTACVRALTTRLLLGCLEEEVTPWDDLPYTVVDCRKHQQLNERAAARSMVLLKNNGLLPLHKETLKTIGVIGPNADSRAALHGNYHGTPGQYITVLEGLIQEAGDEIQVLYSNGCELWRDRTERLAQPGDRIAEAVAAARNSDVVVLCVGLDESIEGEAHHISTGEAAGGDKSDLLLPAVQRELTEAVLAVGVPVILCLMAGSSIDISAYTGRCAAVLLTWYPGARGGRAAAGIIFGRESPAGKLPVTFYGPDHRLPDFADYTMCGRTYRYLEQEPLFPFGYGLTYGHVCCRQAEFDREQMVMTVTAENIGTCDTHEVIQVYCRSEESADACRNPFLCGYASIYLVAGGSVTVRIKLSADTFTVVDDQGTRRSGGHRYTLYTGTHGPDALSEKLTGTPVLIRRINLAEKGDL